MLLTPLLNYISIILVKYHNFLHLIFDLDDMCIARGFSRLRRLNSEAEIQIKIFCELNRKRFHARPFLTTGGYYKKSHMYTSSISYIGYNGQLPMSSRALIRSHQNKVALFRATMWHRVKKDFFLILDFLLSHTYF